MTATVQSRYTHEQIVAWLRGLLAIAWADGHFDPEEKALIAELIQDEVAPQSDLDHTTEISPAELATALGNDANAAENFLRTALMVAIADGTYSAAESDRLSSFCTALGGGNCHIFTAIPFATAAEAPAEDTPKAPAGAIAFSPEHHATPLKPIQEWLDHLEVHDPRVARFLCKLIPPQCPFERDIMLFGHKIVHIPPMCKLNPLYEQLVGLRFRALSYLADDCGEDVARYC